MFYHTIKDQILLDQRKFDTIFFFTHTFRNKINYSFFALYIGNSLTLILSILQFLNGHISLTDSHQWWDTEKIVITSLKLPIPHKLIAPNATINWSTPRKHSLKLSLSLSPLSFSLLWLLSTCFHCDHQNESHIFRPSYTWLDSIIISLLAIIRNNSGNQVVFVFLSICFLNFELLPNRYEWSANL